MTQRAGKWFWSTTGALSLIVMIGLGCHDADRYVLTSDSSVSVDQLFLLTVQGDSVQRADGFSRTRFVAQVMDVTEGVRTVLFTTTAGTLRIGGRTRADSLLVETDLQGKAEIELVSPSAPATAQVVATIAGIKPALTQQRNIRFKPITAENILAFEGLPDTVIIGDTAHNTDIQVRIDPGLEGEDRRVTFTTSIGRFLFGTGTGGRTRDVLADINGVAKVTLEIPESGGEAVVTAAVRGFSLNKTIRFLTLSAISFVGPPASAPADGATLTRLSVLILSEVDRGANLSVEFVTTAGTLVSGDQEGSRLLLQARAKDTTAVFLRSPRQVGAAVVTASLTGGSSTERFVTFNLASPDSVILAIDPTKFQLRPREQTTIQATLVRTVGRGQVSQGLRVSFAAADSLGRTIPLARFFNVTLADQNGQVSAIFTPDGSAFRGLVTIRATYADADKTVSGTANVRIIDE
jgi:hypothetical protein